MTSIKSAVNLAQDVKKNQFLKILDDFDKRYLRLKIVQNSKKQMPEFRENQGLGFDADQMSMSGTSSYSESQLSSTSGRSGLSGYSETSKKSWRDKKNEKKKKKTLRKKRQVKEGSPFEEDNLIEMLKEEVVITKDDKEQVKNIINALIYFGLIDTSTYLHSLVDKLMKAQKTCQTALFSVEQQKILESQPDIQEYYFSDVLGNQRMDESHAQAVQEWENLKFYKH